MNFETWEPVYEAILADFDFDRTADEATRDRLAELTGPFDERRLQARFDGQAVAVAGAAPSLSDELPAVREADVVIAASAAADMLLEADCPVDLLVTDLDKNPLTGVRLSADGVPVAIHAHGDNRQAVEDWVPHHVDRNVLPTTQAAPLESVRNYGGFTDGDRGAFLADHFGAARLVFPGWDFDDPTVDAEKAHKLEWAERLLAWLERRRAEDFAVLDGRREAIPPVGD